MIKDLEGVWHLREWTVTNAKTGAVVLPFNGDVEGYLMYTPEGWVSASLMRRNRTPVCEDRMQLRTLCEAPPQDPQRAEQVWQWFVAAFGYVAYCGRFEVIEEQVHHHLATSMIPQWVGTTLVRDIEWRDNKQQLHLAAPSDQLSDRLLWERVSGGFSICIQN